jgi:glycosyltransferase involved in cell wall biosynthesis
MKKRSHIAMILPDRIEHPVGGMGVQAKYLIKHLEKEFEFSVHGFPDDTALPFYHSVFGALPKIKHGGVNALTGQIAYFASIMKMIKNGTRPNLIHVLDYTEYLAGMYAAKTLDIPLVAYMQLSAHLMEQVGMYSAREPFSPDGVAIQNSMREMEMMGLQEADHIIHVSNMYKNFFSEIPGLEQKSTFIPNGVDLEEFEKYEKMQLPGNGRLKVLYLGRFAPQKNVASLLQAYIPGDIDLILVGEQQGEKRSAAKNIHYFGPAYGQKKINLLWAADAVIIPSLHECHPLVMHEAMAARSVVLHSGAGDMQEILTPDFSINCGTTPLSIEIALQTLRTLSDEEREAMTRRGYEIVKQYTWKKAAEKTKAVYKELL